MKNRPAIYPEHPDLDVLAELSAVSILARNIKPGHVILDPDFHTPLYSVDHRCHATARSGEIALLVFDYDTRTYREVRLLAAATIPLAAA